MRWTVEIRPAISRDLIMRSFMAFEPPKATFIKENSFGKMALNQIRPKVVLTNLASRRTTISCRSSILPA